MSLNSSSSVGSVGCGASCDETTQAVKRRKLEDPQQEPVSPTAPGLAAEEDHDSVTAQVGAHVLRLKIGACGSIHIVSRCHRPRAA